MYYLYVIRAAMSTGNRVRAQFFRKRSIQTYPMC